MKTMAKLVKAGAAKGEVKFSSPNLRNAFIAKAKTLGMTKIAGVKLSAGQLADGMIRACEFGDDPSGNVNDEQVTNCAVFTMGCLGKSPEFKKTAYYMRRNKKAITKIDLTQADWEK